MNPPPGSFYFPKIFKVVPLDKVFEMWYTCLQIDKPPTPKETSNGYETGQVERVLCNSLRN